MKIKKGIIHLKVNRGKLSYRRKFTWQKKNVKVTIKTPLKCQKRFLTPKSRSTRKKQKLITFKASSCNKKNLFGRNESESDSLNYLSYDTDEEISSDGGNKPNTPFFFTEEHVEEKQYTTWTSTTKTPLQDELEDLLPEVLNEFVKAGVEKYLTNFFKLVSSKKFDFNNIAFLLFCDVVQFLSKESTCQMRYEIPATKKFWYLSNLLFQGRLRRFMTGYKHQGSLLSGQSQKGYFDPSISKINFAIPKDPSSSMKSIFKTPEITGPGKFIDMIKLFALRGGTFVLTFDGKKLAPGLTEDSGDVDLLGFEQGKSLAERKEQLATKIETIDTLTSCLLKYKLSLDDNIEMIVGTEKIETINSLKLVHLTISEVLKDLRQFINKKRYMLDSFVVRNEKADSKKYDYVIDSLKTLIFRGQSTIRNAMHVIDGICKSISTFHGMASVYVSKDVVKLDQQVNFVSIGDPEKVKEAMSLESKEMIPPEFVKQRTDEWHKIRNSVKVTGSSAHYAVGMESLKRQKEAVKNAFLPTNQVKEITVNEAMKHGTEHEIHGLATLTSKVIPTYFPSLTYFEEGCYIYSQDNTKMLEVSPDGSLRKVLLTDIEQENRYLKRKPVQIAVEVKCPFPMYKYALPVYYTLPKRYICQIMSEMKVLDCSEILLLSWSSESTTVFKIDFNEEFFNTMMTEVFEKYYETTEPKTISKTSEHTKKLKELAKTISSKAEFIGEFKSVNEVTGEPNDCYIGSNSDSSVKADNIKTPLITTIEDLLTTLNLAKNVYKDAYQVQRQKASEVMPILLSSVDREWNPETGHATPIGYFLRGYSLNTDGMRAIADDFQEECHKHDVHVPIQTFDGQWLKLVIRDKNNCPLTELEFAKDHWVNIKKKSKSELIQTIRSTKYPYICQKLLKKNNISGEMKAVYYLTLEPGCKIIYLSHKSSQKEVKSAKTLLDESTVDQLSEEANQEIAQVFSEDNQIIEQDENDNIVDVSKPFKGHDQTNKGDIDETEPMQPNTEDVSYAHEKDTETEMTGKQGYTMNDTDFLEILGKFQNTTLITEWKYKTLEDVRNVFESASTLLALKDTELKEIARVLNAKAKAVGKKINAYVTKQKKLEMICDLLGFDIDPKSAITKVTRRKKIPKLSELAGKKLTKFPKDVLVSAYATYTYDLECKKWQEKGHLGETLKICTSEREFSPFYRPEYSNKRHQLEIKVIDGTHIRTNLRGAICRNSVKGLRKQAWQEVCDKGTTRLNSTMIEIQADGKVLDQQKESFARTLFSQEVEDAMLTICDYDGIRKYEREAEFVRLMRNWTEAEDEPGIISSVRCDYALDLRDWLLKDVTFNTFPVPGRYIKGIPRATYQALICNIEAHIYAYSICKTKTYNWRALSSLVAETFMSEIDYMDNWSRNGVLTAYGAKMHMRTVCEVHAIQHDPNRGFHMKLSKAPTYKINEADFCEAAGKDVAESMPTESTDEKLYCIHPRDHLFDQPERRLTKKIRTGTLSHPDAPARGTQPIRAHYKVDESRILPSKRLGIKFE